MPEIKKNTEIPVFFASDSNYLPFLAVTIRSMIANASPDYRYCVYILNTGLRAEEAQRVKKMETENVTISFVDVSAQLAPIEKYLNLRDYYTPSIYFRLFIPALFPQYDKAIYLDCDIVIPGDISQLYEMPLGEHLAAVVSDDIVAGHPVFRSYSKNALGIEYQRYFNSGMMLMNLEKFRREGITDKIFSLMKRYGFDTICPDQDYLNITCRDRVLYLDKSWNKMSTKEPYFTQPNIIHYNMYKKPWLYDNVPFEKYFWTYASQTDFYEQILAQKADFGWDGKLKHQIANRRLLRHSKRIIRSDKNFYQVLKKEA